MYLISQLHCLWCHEHLMLTFYICAWSEHNSFACYEDLNDACMIWAQFCCFYYLDSHEFTVFYCFLSLLGYDFLLVQNLAQLHCLDDYLNHMCMIWAQINYWDSMLSTMSWYVVRVGRQTGVFSSWEACHAQVDGFSGACYKKYRTKEEAFSAFYG